jgi:Na+:H+ antiporter, NhaA family
MRQNIQNIQKKIQKIALPVREFITELELGGLLLLVATVLALIFSNSIWADSFLDFWHSEISLRFMNLHFKTDMLEIINDGLMTLFFIVVGGEIKRELVSGTLSSFDRALLPVLAALGGMLFPALIYVLCNWGQATLSGWAIPTATDIAFSLTALSLLGKKIPFSLKMFLAALAIADDLGAIVVIAIFYAHTPDLLYLGLALLAIAILFLFNYWRVFNLWLYIAVGLALWILFYKAGIHPTMAGVIFALAIPVSVKNWEESLKIKTIEFEEFMVLIKDKKLIDTIKQSELINQFRLALSPLESPLTKVLETLQPISTLLIMPLFALSNAGVSVNLESFQFIYSPIGLGILLGLMVGKSTGIFCITWLAVKFKFASIPSDLNWKMLYGMAWLAGIGFTMSMFVTNLAFTDEAYIATAKVSILVASLLSGCVGGIILNLAVKK